MTDDTELPPLDADPDEWAEKWDQPTTITVDRWVKAHLDHQRDGQPWNEYLMKLRNLKADPITFAEVQSIAEYLADQLDGDSEPTDFPTTDVEAALRRVLRDELAEGALDGGRA